MTETTTGEQQSTDKAQEAMTLSEAVRIVRKAIAAEEDYLKQKIATNETTDLVTLVGESDTGYVVHVMAVRPAEVIQTMLNYDYPLYKVLGESAPQRMLNELARITGVDNVFEVDLQPWRGVIS